MIHIDCHGTWRPEGMGHWSSTGTLETWGRIDDIRWRGSVSFPPAWHCVLVWNNSRASQPPETRAEHSNRTYKSVACYRNRNCVCYTDHCFSLPPNSIFQKSPQKIAKVHSSAAEIPTNLDLLEKTVKVTRTYWRRFLLTKSSNQFLRLWENKPKYKFTSL